MNIASELMSFSLFCPEVGVKKLFVNVDIIEIIISFFSPPASMILFGI